MIANCDILITPYSSVVYIGIVLGKKVYSAFELSELMSMVPIQNGGKSAKNIADICLSLLDEEPVKEGKVSTSEESKNFGMTYQPV